MVEFEKVKLVLVGLLFVCFKEMLGINEYWINGNKLIYFGLLG